MPTYLSRDIAIPIVVRYRVLGFEKSGVKILVYLMRLGNAIIAHRVIDLDKKCYNFLARVEINPSRCCRRTILSVAGSRQLVCQIYQFQFESVLLCQDSIFLAATELENQIIYFFKSSYLGQK